MYASIAAISLKRITKYLNADELEKVNDPVCHSEESDEPKSRGSIAIKDGSFSWNKTGEACLKNINLKVQKNSLVAVVGKVGKNFLLHLGIPTVVLTSNTFFLGSGKSSLANALINELKKRTGSVVVNGSISYVPQTSWILNTSLRENIVFMNPFDQELYDQAVKICALDDDLKVLANGDLTEIGEKGINLSGGQKQRVSLARACYNDSDIYILDDPLSAVDSNVGNFIFHQLIGPHGYLKNKTRILITHKIPLLKDVDRIIVLKDGQISEQGSYDELIDAEGEFSEILNTYINEENKAKAESLERLTRVEKTGNSKKSPKKDPLIENTDIDKGRLIEEEKQEVGSVKWSVYRDFLMSMSFWFLFSTLLAYSLSSAFNIATNLWLTAWSEDASDPTNYNNTALRNKRIGFYAGYGFIDSIFNLAATIFFYLGLIQASKNLHVRMLNDVLRAPMLFFDTTPVSLMFFVFRSISHFRLISVFIFLFRLEECSIDSRRIWTLWTSRYGTISGFFANKSSKPSLRL